MKTRPFLRTVPLSLSSRTSAPSRNTRKAPSFNGWSKSMRRWPEAGDVVAAVRGAAGAVVEGGAVRGGRGLVAVEGVGTAVGEAEGLTRPAEAGGGVQALAAAIRASSLAWAGERPAPTASRSRASATASG